jgi:hypothetical protein
LIWYATTLFLGFLLGVFVAALLSAGAQCDLPESEALTGPLPAWGRVRFCGCGGATVVEDLSSVTLGEKAGERFDFRTAEVTQNEWPTSSSGGYSRARSSPTSALVRAQPLLDA